MSDEVGEQWAVGGGQTAAVGRDFTAQVLQPGCSYLSEKTTTSTL